MNDMMTMTEAQPVNDITQYSEIHEKIPLPTTQTIPRRNLSLQQSMIDRNLISAIQHTLQAISIEPLHDHQAVPRAGNDLHHPYDILVLQVQHVGLVPQGIVPAAVLAVLFHDLHRNVLALVQGLDDHAVAAPTQHRVVPTVALAEFVTKEALPIRCVEVDLDQRYGQLRGEPCDTIAMRLYFVLGM